MFLQHDFLHHVELPQTPQYIDNIKLIIQFFPRFFKHHAMSNNFLLFLFQTTAARKARFPEIPKSVNKSLPAENLASNFLKIIKIYSLIFERFLKLPEGIGTLFF